MGSKHLERKGSSSREISKILIIFHIVGIVGLSIGFTRWVFILLTPLHLCFSLGLVLYDHRSEMTKGLISVLAVLFLAGNFVEYLGVHTGMIFGVYEYGDGLGPQLFRIPPVMGVNWVLLVFGSTSLASQITESKLLGVLLAGFFMVFLDVFIEPVAPLLDFWTWEASEVPLRNYFSWFIFSCLFSALFFTVKPHILRPSSMVFFLLQFPFFVIVRLFV